MLMEGTGFLFVTQEYSILAVQGTIRDIPTDSFSYHPTYDYFDPELFFLKGASDREWIYISCFEYVPRKHLETTHWEGNGTMWTLCCSIASAHWTPIGTRSRVLSRSLNDMYNKGVMEKSFFCNSILFFPSIPAFFRRGTWSCIFGLRGNILISLCSRFNLPIHACSFPFYTAWQLFLTFLQTHICRCITIKRIHRSTTTTTCNKVLWWLDYKYCIREMQEKERKGAIYGIGCRMTIRDEE